MIPASQVADIVAQALAAFKADQDASNAAKKTVAAAVESVETVSDQTDEDGKLFGNQDKKKAFDLSKLLPGVKTLPANKVVVVIQKHLKKTDGSVTEDESGRRAQIIEPGDFDVNTRPDKNTGEAIYDTLFGTAGTGGGFTVVHKPE